MSHYGDISLDSGPPLKKRRIPQEPVFFLQKMKYPGRGSMCHHIAGVVLFQFLIERETFHPCHILRDPLPPFRVIFENLPGIVKISCPLRFRSTPVPLGKGILMVSSQSRDILMRSDQIDHTCRVRPPVDHIPQNIQPVLIAETDPLQHLPQKVRHPVYVRHHIRISHTLSPALSRPISPVPDVSAVPGSHTQPRIPRSIS